MAGNGGELYVTVPVDVAVVSSPKQLVPIGQSVTGVIINDTLPAGLTFKICRQNAQDGIRLGDGDAFTNICPPMDGLYGYWSPGIPGGEVKLVVLTAAGQVTR